MRPKPPEHIYVGTDLLSQGRFLEAETGFKERWLRELATKEIIPSYKYQGVRYYNKNAVIAALAVYNASKKQTGRKKSEIPAETVTTQAPPEAISYVSLDQI